MGLNINDIHNILIFLNRTQLNGSEVPVFVEIYSKLKQMSEPPKGTIADMGFNESEQPEKGGE